MPRKRDRPFISRHETPSFPKRLRPPPRPADDDNHSTARPSAPSAVVVLGLPLSCSVLDLKSRFEIYGAISRIRIDRDGVGYITFRSKDSAEAAVKAALDASFGITIESKKVQVLWATDPLAQWRDAVKDKTSSSKLLRAEVPLSRHGRGNKLASAMVNTKSGGGDIPVEDVPFKGREIVAYDDIL